METISGVVIFIKNTKNFEILSDFSNFGDGLFESIFSKVKDSSV